METPSSRIRTIRASALAAVLAAAVVVVPMLDPPLTVSADISLVAAPTSVTVNGHGNGHGHGLSQYGARGAAMAGLSAAAITRFYYPGTTLKTMPSTTKIRVLVSAAPAYVTVGARWGLSLVSASGKAIAGVANPLPTTGISKYRLVPAGSGLQLQRLKGTSWVVIHGAGSLPATVDFHRQNNAIRLYLSGGASTVYRGTVGAVRSGSGELTINRARIDEYAAGVAPREMPASWRASAVQAQAIAARTYAMYEKEHAGSRPYDICDSTQCQVYGGKAHYSAGGTLLWSDFPAALSGNAGKVLQYHGATIFAQYSASNGGWAASGGQPYLTAKADKYDNIASGDPYLNWTRTVSLTSVAHYFGLSRVTKIVVTQRDGHGAWGGRVLTGYVDGVTSSGAAKRVTATGYGLQSAMGLPHNWFSVG
jgi:stage II sporulation protein D